ncbi:MAG: hypothetical protein M5U14_15365 [Acidimicrobiia bacterium]|nr:hypothetical protein [Acidimicrobiia bacterium]
MPGTPRHPTRRLRPLIVAVVASLFGVLPAGPAGAADGDLDVTFGTGGKVTTSVGADALAFGVAVQPDGRIVVVGEAEIGGDRQFVVVRYEADGSLDAGFGSAGVTVVDVGTASDDVPIAVALAPDGKIVVAGVTDAGGTMDLALVRLRTDGSVDPTFGTAGRVITDVAGGADTGWGVAVQPDGRIVVVGSAFVADFDFAVVRYLPDGTLDTTFGGDGRVTTDFGAAEMAKDVALQPDGGIVVAGWTGSASPSVDFALARYDGSSGALDPTFDGDGKVVTDVAGSAHDEIVAVALQPDGKIVAAGYAEVGTARFAAARYVADGSLDTTFNASGSLPGTVVTDPGGDSIAYGVAVERSGAIVLAGRAVPSAGSRVFALVRYEPDGDLDPTFGTGGIVQTDLAAGDADGAAAVALQADGRIVAAGDSDTSPQDFGVARYLSQGALASGYWLVARDGGVFSFSTPFYGSTGAITLNEPIVGGAPTPTGLGYWFVAADGGVFTFGDAVFYGSTGNTVLSQPIVGMAPTPSGRGYWLVASDGGVFTFGDAGFHGSTGGSALNQPIVGMAPTPSGRGYWLVASDGGIFAFGDAAFHGSTGAIALNQPIVGMATTPFGQGYWLVASDGGIFAFGDATFLGSTGAMALNRPIVGMASTRTGAGYWLVASDGGIFSFGDATFLGSTGAIALNQPIVGMAVR